jgi:selenoprotein W-related protein
LRLKQDIRSLRLVPAGGGRFEITVNGQKLYSKLETGSFPDPETILRQVRNLR